MKGTNCGVLLLLILIASVAIAATSTSSTTVDCNQGQSLSATLDKLNKKAPNTVSVSGTCTEYVHVMGFDNLTLTGTAGATLLEPTTGAGVLLNAVLYIQSSQSVTVDGFSIQSTITAPVAIGHGSSDIRLRNLSITGGGTFGIVVFERSQVSIAFVTAQDAGYAALAAYDTSDVHVEHSVFKDSTGSGYHVGIVLGASHLTVYGTAITNMQVGIAASGGSDVDTQTFNTYYAIVGSTDVTINNPTGLNYNGVSIDTGGSLNVAAARLVINSPGQSYGGTTGGVLISDGSAMSSANGNLVISNSHGQGIVVLNDSHATLSGATVTGSAHGGLVAGNFSSIDVTTGTVLTLVGGNTVDLFCDAGSMITGGMNLSGAPIAQCTNLLAAETATLP